MRTTTPLSPSLLRLPLVPSVRTPRMSVPERQGQPDCQSLSREGGHSVSFQTILKVRLPETRISEEKSRIINNGLMSVPERQRQPECQSLSCQGGHNVNFQTIPKARLPESRTTSQKSGITPKKMDDEDGNDDFPRVYEAG